jgi:hypothetical protein
MADIPSGLSLTPPQETKKKKNFSFPQLQFRIVKIVSQQFPERQIIPYSHQSLRGLQNSLVSNSNARQTALILWQSYSSEASLPISGPVYRTSALVADTAYQTYFKKPFISI